MRGTKILYSAPGRQSKSRRKSGPVNQATFARVRRRDIKTLISHSADAPDPESALLLAQCFRAAAPADVTPDDLHWRIADWCAQHAPKVRASHIAAAVKVAMRSPVPRLDNADDAAERLGLTYTDRTQFDIRTIGAIDVPKKERAKFAKQRRKERDRLYRNAQRRAAQKMTRAEYLAQYAKPWIALKISRATWFRRQNETRETGCSPHHLKREPNNVCHAKRNGQGNSRSLRCNPSLRSIDSPESSSDSQQRRRISEEQACG